MKTKLTALMLLLAMLLCLSGCGGAGRGAQTGEAAKGGASDTAANAAQGGADDPYAAAYAAHAPDETVMTINGQGVTWAEYFYCLYANASQIAALGQSDWDADASAIDSAAAGQTLQEYVRTRIEEGIFLPYWSIEQKAGELGVTLSEEDRAEIDAYYQQTVDGYFGGDEQAFLDDMAKNYFPVDFDNRMNAIDYLYMKLYERTFGEDGADLPEKDALSYARDAGYIQAKHILFKTVDDNNAPLPEEEIAAKRADAEAVLAELRGITDNDELCARFDELIAEKGEDPGMETYTGGYVFPDGVMVPEFRAAAEELEEYGVSDLVETSYGYHIILRLPLDVDAPEMSNGYGVSMRTLAAEALFSNMAEEWFDEAELTYCEGFGTMDFNELIPLAAAAQAGGETEP